MASSVSMVAQVASSIAFHDESQSHCVTGRMIVAATLPLTLPLGIPGFAAVGKVERLPCVTVILAHFRTVFALITLKN